MNITCNAPMDYGTCLREEELTRETYQESLKPPQTMPLTPDEKSQRIRAFQNCLDRLEKQVADPQTMLEAKDQSTDALEREKLNKTHIKHSLNLWGSMKYRTNDKPNCKGSERTHSPLSKDNEHRHESHTVEDRHEEEPLTNANLKDDPGTSVSDEHQPGQGHRLTKKLSIAVNKEQSQTSTFSSKAPKRSSSLEPIARIADIASI